MIVFPWAIPVWLSSLRQSLNVVDAGLGGETVVWTGGTETGAGLTRVVIKTTQNLTVDGFVPKRKAM